MSMYPPDPGMMPPQGMPPDMPMGPPMGPPPGMPMGPPPGIPPEALMGPPSGEGPPDPQEIVRQAFSLLEEALKAEDDDSDSHALVKAMNILQGLLAGRQKEAEQATGVSPAAKFLARGRS